MGIALHSSTQPHFQAPLSSFTHGENLERGYPLPTWGTTGLVVRASEQKVYGSAGSRDFPSHIITVSGWLLFGIQSMHMFNDAAYLEDCKTTQFIPSPPAVSSAALFLMIILPTAWVEEEGEGRWSCSIDHQTTSWRGVAMWQMRSNHFSHHVVNRTVLLQEPCFIITVNEQKCWVQPGLKYLHSAQQKIHMGSSFSNQFDCNNKTFLLTGKVDSGSLSK